LRCRFIRVSLDDLSYPYAAISYCWGDSRRCERIWCSDNEYLDVNVSAMSVVRNVAIRVQPSWVWLDQVCIDQENISEKESQVHMMNDIFRYASAVVAWVGDPSANSSLAMDHIKCAANAIQDLKQSDQPITPDTLRQSPGCRYPSPAWQALGDLLRRPWFQRVWVVQEIAVSEKAYLYHSGKKVDWSRLAFVIETLSELDLGEWCKDKKTLEYPRGYGSVRQMNKIRNYILQGMYGDLPLVFRKTLDFDSTDPRDKVFAILGITRDGQNWRSRPDYHASIEDVYIQSVVRMVRTQQLLKTKMVLDFLHLAGIGWPQRLKFLPSWVPDWSRRTGRSFLYVTDGEWQFQAAGNSKPKINVDAISRKITLEGMLIGTVNVVSAPFPFDTNPSAGLDIRGAHRVALDWLKETMQLCRDHQEHVSVGEGWKETYWRTLVANMTVDGNKATPQYGCWFETLLTRYTLGAESDCKHETGCRCFVDTADALLYWSAVYLLERTFVTTSHDFVGLSPEGTLTGDNVVLFSGAVTPFIIRELEPESPDNDEKSYALVGEAYIHQLMNGEGLEMGGSLQDIVLR
jgi:Heterokaryon incompatibility protein (HET)